MAPEQIARLGLALVPEGRQIFKTLTVAENLRWARGARRRAPHDGADAWSASRSCASEPDSGPTASRAASSSSWRSPARCSAEPRLLILDEPSLGLAPKMIDVIYELLEGLREEGMTMLLVEQNAARTIDFCDRCLVLGGGKVRAQGGREELQRDPEVLRAYMGGQR